MAFEKNDLGQTVWKNPGKVRPKDFIERLSPKNKNNIVLPDSVQADLSSFMRRATESTDKLAQANKHIYHSIGKLPKSDKAMVDIIIPVYDGTHVLKECVESVLERTAWPYQITLVDDCSPDPHTQDYLMGLEVSSRRPFTILRNKKNKGFAASVNKGITATSNPYVCLLNSDVIVTPNWLTKMILALEADERNKIVNPMTNNTALIDVPMRPGASYLDMNTAFERLSSRSYPRS